MKRKYCTPLLTVEELGVSHLLVEASNIPIGGTGHFDAKESGGFYDYDDEEGESE